MSRVPASPPLDPFLSPAAPCCHAALRECLEVLTAQAVAGRLQAFERDPSQWATWGAIGAREGRREGQRSTRNSSKKLPMVSVLLPVKGVHERTLLHWRSQVKATHGGAMEFIFCMESEDDPAYAAAQEFRRECGDSTVIKIVSCGLSFYCSQKIHNLLKGITLINKEAEYVLFLDDDAQMSSAILSDLVHALETDSEVLIASGWPNDFIPPDMSSTPTFASFMLLAYRILSHLSMGTLYPTVLWGGCLLWRRAELLDSRIGVLEAWQESGYSDDMIMIGRCRKAHRKIVIPPSAFLPSRIEHSYTLERHVNYIRRQMFVCGTYHDIYDRLNNLFLLVVVCIILVLLGCFNFQLLVVYSVWSFLRLAVTDPLSFLPTQLAQPQLCGHVMASPAALHLLVLVAAVAWMRAMALCYKSVVAVCERSAGRPGTYSHSMNPFKFTAMLWFGFMAQCLLQSSSAALAFCTDNIVWSGACLNASVSGRIGKGRSNSWASARAS